MEQIPKIVTHSLRQMAPVNAHPDADLLTAFAERSLPDAERASVLQHLSACADCREVVALATPALEPAQAVLRPSWIRGAAFRWAALAACMVVVGTAVTLYQRHEPPSRLATYNENTPEPSTSAATVEPALPQTKSDSTSESKPATKTDAMLSKAQPAAASKAADLAQARSEAPRRAEPSSGAIVAMSPPAAKVAAPQPQTRVQTETASNAAPAPRSDVSSANEQVTVEAGAAPEPSVSAVSETVPAAPGKAKDQPSALEKQTLARSSGNAAGVLVDKLSAKEESAKNLDRKKAEPAPAQTAGLATNAVAGQFQPGPTTESERLATYGAALAPRFTISAAGKLARSFDQGKTWLPVPVDGKSTFRAISANASDVWAAGNGGALFHSVDGGEHWAQVKPVIGGAALTADIVRIVARDAKHLQLSTADHQLWSTSDGGATWQLQ